MFCVFQSRHNTEEFTLFTLDDVDMAFDKIETLKYSQSLSLKGATHILHYCTVLLFTFCILLTFKLANFLLFFLSIL